MKAKRGPRSHTATADRPDSAQFREGVSLLFQGVGELRDWVMEGGLGKEGDDRVECGGCGLRE